MDASLFGLRLVSKGLLASRIGKIKITSLNEICGIGPSISRHSGFDEAFQLQDTMNRRFSWRSTWNVDNAWTHAYISHIISFWCNGLALAWAKNSFHGLVSWANVSSPLSKKTLAILSIDAQCVHIELSNPKYCFSIRAAYSTTSPSVFPHRQIYSDPY